MLITTLSDIEKSSKLTRGALLHHFPNKQALFAAALVRLCRLRIETFQAPIKSRKAGLRANIDIIHKEVREWFPLTVEFMNAMRTDYASLFPELSNAKSPLLVQYVIG